MKRSDQDQNIDALIDSALRWERGLLPAPPSLREAVAARIRYASMRDRERRRFRGALGALFGGAAAAFAIVVGAVLYAMAQPAGALGLPGAGAVEYHLARWVSLWSDVRAEAVPYLGAGLAIAVLLAGALPLGRRLLNN